MDPHHDKDCICRVCAPELYHYDHVVPIRQRVASVWECKFGDGEKRLYVLDKDFTVPEIIQMIKVHHSRPFRIRQITVGEFILDHVHTSYCSDGRWVDQDLMICID